MGQLIGDRTAGRDHHTMPEDHSSPSANQPEQTANVATPSQQAGQGQSQPERSSPPHNADPVLLALSGTGWPRPELKGSYEGPFRKMYSSGVFEWSWNWMAFLFGSLWYLYQGMWAKAILYFVLAGVVAAALTPALGPAAQLVVWILYGAIANHDLWLWRHRNNQWW